MSIDEKLKGGDAYSLILDDITAYASLSRASKVKRKREAQKREEIKSKAKEDSARRSAAIKEGWKKYSPVIVGEIVSLFENKEVRYLLEEKGCEVIINEYDPRNNPYLEEAESRRLWRDMEKRPYPEYVLSAYSEGFRVRVFHRLIREYPFPVDVNQLLQEDGFWRVANMHIGLSEEGPEMKGMANLRYYLTSQLKNCMEGRTHGWGW
jgi:hypothetical protein